MNTFIFKKFRTKRIMENQITYYLTFPELSEIVISNVLNEFVNFFKQNEPEPVEEEPDTCFNDNEIVIDINDEYSLEPEQESEFKREDYVNMSLLELKNKARNRNINVYGTGKWGACKKIDYVNALSGRIDDKKVKPLCTKRYFNE